MIVFKFGYVLKDVVVMNIVIVQYGFGSTKLCVWWYVHYWDMGTTCYAFVAEATSRDPYSVILIGTGNCVLHLRGGSHL